MNQNTADQPERPSKATPEALAIIGAFSSPEDAALMDEVMELIEQERERQKAMPPPDFDFEPQP